MTRLADALGNAVRPRSLTGELQTTVANLRSLYAAAACSCALVNPSGDGLRFVVADGVGAEQIVGVDIALDEGVAGWVALSGQAMVVGEASADPRFARDVAERTGYVPTRILAAPMTDGDGTAVGVLEVLDPATSPGGGTGDDLTVLSTMAALACSVVRLSAAYDRLGETLLTTLTRAEHPDEIRAALAAIAGDPEGDEPDLAGLALAFHDLARTGPAGVRLAERLLTEVAAFAGSAR